MCPYKADEFQNAAAEEIDSAEDLVLREIKLLSLRHREKLVLRDPVVLVVGFVQPGADLQLLYQRLWLLLPQFIVVLVFEDNPLAIQNHLRGKQEKRARNERRKEGS